MSRRRRVAAAVAARDPVDERERGSRARFLAELERLTAPFDEHADPTHVTASAVVTGPQGVLLHRHKRVGIWMQPGGHVDPGEEPEAAAVREVLEETGLLGSHPVAGAWLAHVDVHPAARGHTHLDLRYLLHADGRPVPPQGESPHVRWFPWDEACAVADPALIGALQAVRALDGT